ncbi:MAG TPA: hypothetical protein V6D05_17270 [Stenomitos sp.]
MTTPIRDERVARTPLQEAISLVPYVWVYQRMHRRRWAQGLAAAAAVAGLAVLAMRRRR